MRHSKIHIHVTHERPSNVRCANESALLFCNTKSLDAIIKTKINNIGPHTDDTVPESHSASTTTIPNALITVYVRYVLYNVNGAARFFDEKQMEERANKNVPLAVWPQLLLRKKPN